MGNNSVVKLQQFYKKRRIIILGGSGFIGSNLASALNELCADIVVVDGFIDGTGGNVCNLENININLIHSRIEDMNNWKDAIEPNSVL